MDPDAVERQAPEQLDGGDGVPLLLGQEIRVRGITRVPAYGVLASLIPVVKHTLLIFRGEAQGRMRGGEYVLNSIPQTPPATRPGARVKRLGAQIPPMLRDIPQSIETRCRVLEERRLGKEGDRVLQIGQVIHVPRVPYVELLHMGSPHLATLL